MSLSKEGQLQKTYPKDEDEILEKDRKGHVDAYDETAEKDEDEIPEKDRKGHVDAYDETAEFPFEKDDVVWIVKPEYRAPLGDFRITKAHPDDMYELVRCSDNAPHSELVEGKYLRRNP